MCIFVYLFFLFIFYFFFPPFIFLFSFKGEGLEQENRVSNNIVIGLSGTDGLSNIETLSPAGIYIRAPASHVRVRSSGIRHNISFLIKEIRKTQNFIYLGHHIHNICFVAEQSEPVLVMGYWNKCILQNKLCSWVNLLLRTLLCLSGMEYYSEITHPEIL